jgi:hypothetical protein
MHFDASTTEATTSHPAHRQQTHIGSRLAECTGMSTCCSLVPWKCTLQGSAPGRQPSRSPAAAVPGPADNAPPASHLHQLPPGCQRTQKGWRRRRTERRCRAAASPPRPASGAARPPPRSRPHSCWGSAARPRPPLQPATACLPLVPIALPAAAPPAAAAAAAAAAAPGWQHPAACQCCFLHPGPGSPPPVLPPGPLPRRGPPWGAGARLPPSTPPRPPAAPPLP